MGTRKALPAELTPTVDNILQVFFEANDEQLSSGLGWYAMAHANAARIAHGDVECGAGVIAALSPLTNWDRNVFLAEKAFLDDHASGSFFSNCAKADAIMFGWKDPLVALGGDKVRNFYRAIVDPADPEPVVIDRHAFAVAIGRVATDTERDTMLKRRGVYAQFAECYREAALSLSHLFSEYIPPSAVQAVTWLVWRDTKAIDPEYARYAAVLSSGPRGAGL